MKKQSFLIWGLILLFSVLMSIAFLVPHCGFFALFAFVPLLCAEHIMSQLSSQPTTGKKYQSISQSNCQANSNRQPGWKHVNLCLFVGFVLWNSFTTFWVCNATIGGGITAILVNSAVMTAIFALFRVFRKHFKRGGLSYIFLVASWIAWEKIYFKLDISWPWLTLGNAFSRTISLVQWYEYLGTLGGSLWIWMCNLGIFGLMLNLSNGRWSRYNSKAKFSSLFSLLMVFLLPITLSLIIWYSDQEESKESINVMIVQPNIDPYNKFTRMSQAQQNAILKDMIDKNLEAADSNGLLILAPETFTSDVVVGQYDKSPTWNYFSDYLSEHPNVNLLFGASTYEYIYQNERPSDTARKIYDGLWYESHNSALMLDGSKRTEIFHKSRLVVAVEQLPYPKVFGPIDRALGGVMGHCVGQDEISLLNYIDTNKATNKATNKDTNIDTNIDINIDTNAEAKRIVPIGCIICYESVYGDYCRGYIQKGAKALTVITNDAWWGDTPGYKQHLSYSSLRAIETRRAIARCGNTGISGFIDTKGRLVAQGPWWEKAVMRGELPLYDKISFFVEYGDIVGRYALTIFILLFAYLFITIVQKCSSKARN